MILRMGGKKEGSVQRVFFAKGAHKISFRRRVWKWVRGENGSFCEIIVPLHLKSIPTQWFGDNQEFHREGKGSSSHGKRARKGQEAHYKLIEGGHQEYIDQEWVSKRGLNPPENLPKERRRKHVMYWVPFSRKGTGNLLAAVITRKAILL